MSRDWDKRKKRSRRKAYIQRLKARKKGQKGKHQPAGTGQSSPTPQPA